MSKMLISIDENPDDKTFEISIRKTLGWSELQGLTIDELKKLNKKITDFIKSKEL